MRIGRKRAAVDFNDLRIKFGEQPKGPAYDLWWANYSILKNRLTIRFNSDHMLFSSIVSEQNPAVKDAKEDLLHMFAAAFCVTDLQQGNKMKNAFRNLGIFSKPAKKTRIVKVSIPRNMAPVANVGTGNTPVANGGLQQKSETDVSSAPKKEDGAAIDTVQESAI